jgi:hypothetical protein
VFEASADVCREFFVELVDTFLAVTVNDTFIQVSGKPSVVTLVGKPRVRVR